MILIYFIVDETVESNKFTDI